MTKEQIYIRGCALAIDNLLQKGSTHFAVEVKRGVHQLVSWDEIIDWLDKQYKECDKNEQ